MKSILVKELMVPLSEYTTVNDDATLSDALDALESAQTRFDEHRCLHRAVLVCEKSSGTVVGKLSQLDVIRSLEPKYELFTPESKPFAHAGTSHFGFSPKFMKDVLEQYELWFEPLSDIFKKAKTQKVVDVMHKVSEGECVKEDANLGEAVHMLIMGHHHSLLVTRNDDITGILRLTDVFREICRIKKQNS